MKSRAAMVVTFITAGIASCIPGTNAKETRQTWDGPEHFWQSSCGYCHGGAAGAPELRGTGLRPEVIAIFARQGAPGMPPFHASEISDAELKQLAEWISAQPKPQKQP